MSHVIIIKNKFLKECNKTNTRQQPSQIIALQKRGNIDIGIEIVIVIASVTEIENVIMIRIEKGTTKAVTSIINIVKVTSIIDATVLDPEAVTAMTREAKRTRNIKEDTETLDQGQTPGLLNTVDTILRSKGITLLHPNMIKDLQILQDRVIKMIKKRLHQTASILALISNQNLVAKMTSIWSVTGTKQLLTASTYSFQAGHKSGGKGKTNGQMPTRQKSQDNVSISSM